MSKDNIKSWLTDMDGVLVHENKASRCEPLTRHSGG